jgi:hypothetical protein
MTELRFLVIVSHSIPKDYICKNKASSQFKLLTLVITVKCLILNDVSFVGR